jgi:DNA polymerase V
LPTCASPNWWAACAQVQLRAANPSYADIIPREGQTLEVWGVVTAAIRQFVK